MTQSFDKEVHYLNSVLYYQNRIFPLHWYGTVTKNFVSFAGRIVACPAPYDRTGTFNIMNVDYDPIPTNFDNTMSFEDCCIDRGNYLWSKEKPITLYWSGGIDSTTSLTSLLLTQPKGADLKVILTVESIAENNSYYEKIKSYVDLEIIESSKSALYDSKRFYGDRVLVNGECGDPTFGTFVVQNHTDQLESDWKCVFDWDDQFFNAGVTPFTGRIPDLDQCIEFCERYIALCPFEVRTAFDFTWWLAFALKWQWIDRRFLGNVDYTLGWRNLYSFFNNQEFQKWSIVHHDKKHKGTWKTYKWPAKEFIYKYNPDRNYLENKTKETSIPRAVGYSVVRNPTYKLIMTDGQAFRIGEPLKDISRWDVLNHDTFINDYQQTI